MTQTVIKGRLLADLLPLLEEKYEGKLLFVVGRHLLADESFQAFLAKGNFAAEFMHSPEGLLQINDVPLRHDLQIVVAIGGGKVIDFAKGIINKQERRLYFITVPTTAGSGSEATPFAVFYNGKEKVSLDNALLLPQTVLLDDDLLKALPQKQKVVSGADAFAQCIESVWNVKSTSASETFALEGLEILYRLLPKFVEASDNNLGSQVLAAAHLSGKAIAFTRTTGPHALSYYLTAHHGIPHGQAVALFLPLFFLYNAKAESQLRKIYKCLNVNTAEEAFETCRHFLGSIKLATTFKETGLNNVDVEALIGSVNKERFANNPAAFDATVLKDLIRRYLC